MSVYSREYLYPSKIFFVLRLKFYFGSFFANKITLFIVQ